MNIQGLPSQLFVGHLIFDMKFGDHTLLREAKALGILDDVKLTITLDPKLPPRLMAETALHESLHAIYAAYSFGIDALEEEELVSRISGPLLKLQQDNPEFFAWIDWLMQGTPIIEWQQNEPAAF